MKKILSLKALIPEVRGPGGYIKDTFLPSLALSAHNDFGNQQHDTFLESKTPAHPFSRFQHYVFMTSFSVQTDSRGNAIMQLMTYFIQALKRRVRLIQRRNGNVSGLCGAECCTNDFSSFSRLLMKCRFGYAPARFLASCFNLNTYF